MLDIIYVIRKFIERKRLYKGTNKANRIQKKMNSSLFKNEILNKPHIFRIELINTLKCNAKCSHCSNHKLCDDSTDIKPEIVDRILEEALINKTPSITFLGGESLLDENIFKYLGMFVKAEMGVALSTNCLLIDKKMIRKLKEIGINGFGTTIYDSVPENHDKVIGVEGTFNNIKQIIANAREIDLPFSLCTVYTKEIAENGALDRMMNFAFENDKTLKINLVTPIGGSADESLMLSASEIVDIKKCITENSKLSTHSIFNGKEERCPMGRTYIGVTPEGDMLPCYFMPISMGNIKDYGFSDYLKYTQSFPIFRKNGLDKGFCIVAESKKFYKEIIAPLYKGDYLLPVQLREFPELEEKLRSFEL